MADHRDDARVVALVTYDALPALSDDDQLLASALHARGIGARAVVWRDPAVRWESFDAVVVRSCWDYFLRPAEFFAWLDRMELARARVFNPVATMRWNADKGYLRELAAEGIPVVPTHWVERGASESLRAVRRQTGWTELVVKPAISGSANETWRASPGTERDDDSRLGAMSAAGRVLVQPLVEVVTDAGEWSMVFIDGTFSHAVLKRPRAGDFRVQIEHGGTFEPEAPPAGVITQAARTLRARALGDVPPLYARVDGCIVDDTLLLMELELIEPALFLGTADGAADRLAEAVERRISREIE